MIATALPAVADAITDRHPTEHPDDEREPKVGTTAAHVEAGPPSFRKRW